jgi:monoterpene epsilon-lactone hydrolase
LFEPAPGFHVEPGAAIRPDTHQASRGIWRALTPSARSRASLQNNLIVRVVLPIRGGKRRYASVERTSRHIAARAARPARFTPPRRLHRRVTVSREDCQGWPVYRVEPLQGSRPSRRVLHFHGGAYINEITRSHWSVAARLARETPCQYLLPIYPLGARAGAAVVVATATEIAVRALQASGDLVLSGDSAGGGLALAVGLALRDRGLRPARIILLSPWLDVRTDQPQQLTLERRDAMLAVAGLREAARTYARGMDLDDPRISPLNGDLGGLPPITVFSGTADILNPDSHRLHERCGQAGVSCELVEAPGMPHVYPLMPTPEGRDARRRIIELLRES